ncbi:MAG: hypothetical protein C4534_08175 [Gaiellales bacterium]|nr:MAG: hypothetical protein C4534_08175 [Gaiellales bacterium]
MNKRAIGGGFPTDEEFKQHHYTIKAIIDEMSAKRKQIHELMRPSLEAEDAMTAEERALIDHLRREGRLSKHRN